VVVAVASCPDFLEFEGATVYRHRERERLFQELEALSAREARGPFGSSEAGAKALYQWLLHHPSASPKLDHSLGNQVLAMTFAPALAIHGKALKQGISESLFRKLWLFWKEGRDTAAHGVTLLAANDGGWLVFDPQAESHRAWKLPQWIAKIRVEKKNFPWGTLTMKVSGTDVFLPNGLKYSAEVLQSPEFAPYVGEIAEHLEDEGFLETRNAKAIADLTGRKSETPPRREVAQRLYDWLDRHPILAPRLEKEGEPYRIQCHQRAFGAQLKALEWGVPSSSLAKLWLSGDIHHGGRHWKYQSALAMETEDGWMVIDPEAGALSDVGAWYRFFKRYDEWGLFRLVVTPIAPFDPTGRKFSMDVFCGYGGTFRQFFASFFRENEAATGKPYSEAVLNVCPEVGDIARWLPR
jgi:hypothetical protein